MNSFDPSILSADPAPNLHLVVSDPATVYAAAWRQGPQAVAVAANGGRQPATVRWTLTGVPTLWYGQAKVLAADHVELEPGQAVAVKLP